MNDSTNLSADQQSSAQPDLFNQALTPAKPSALRKIFIGADGLRALWSLLIFTALLAALLMGVIAVGKRMHLFPPKGATNTELTSRFVFFSESFPFLATLLVTWIMSKIEKRSHLRLRSG